MAVHRSFDCSRCILGRAAQPAPCPLFAVERPAGTLLVRQGEVPEAVWLVRRGLVLLTSTSASGDETLCALRTQGSLIGFEALRQEPTDYEAWTLEPSSLCRLYTQGLCTWIGDAASPTRAFLELALDEVARTREERVALAGSSLERVARFLVEHLSAAGRPSLFIEHHLLARMLRMRPETLSRALAQLREAGAIANDRAVRVLDPQLLGRIGGDSS